MADAQHSPLESLDNTPVLHPAEPREPVPAWKPWGFLAVVAGLFAIHLGFMNFVIPRLEYIFMASGAPLPLLVKLYLNCASIFTHRFIPLGSMALVGALGWLLGIHLMLRRHPLAQRVYCNLVYFGLLIILVLVYALSISLGLTVVEFN